MISKQLRREVGVKKVKKLKRRMLRKNISLKQKARKVFRVAVKRTYMAAKKFPGEVARDVSQMTGKPIKKLKHKKVTGYEAAFGRSLFK